MIHRGFRYRLYPTDEQRKLFEQFAGVTRLVYNLALDQRRDFWRQFLRETGKHFNYANQGLEITELRRQFDWIQAVPFDCLVQALRDLDRAYSAFFKQTAKYPSPRKKGVNDSFRFQGRDVQVRKLNAKWSDVRIPKVGWVRFRDSRPMDGRSLNVTISYKAGIWNISFARGIQHELSANDLPSVGIDRGVANTLALSNGEMLSMPEGLIAMERKHRTAQRAIHRRKKGSRRRMLALRRAANIAARRARIRGDWHHKTALSIARRFGVVAMEDLKVSSMTASAAGTVDNPACGVRQKAGLNRSILNQGWFAFETILAYKLEERGGELIKVPAAYTSQTCSECGTVDSKSRESQAIFSCQHCGFAAHADHNAAINILRGSTPSMRVEDSRRATGEARTGLSREVHENHLAPAG